MDKFFAISAKRNSPVGKNRALSSLIKKLTQNFPYTAAHYTRPNFDENGTALI